MNKITRWNYELVLDFVKNNSKCLLLSTEFKTEKNKMLFKCNCGNEFETTFERFRLRNKRQCNSCGFIEQLKKQSLSYDEVKRYVTENSNSELLDTEYVNVNSKLKFKCKCGEIFFKSFYKFKNKSKTCKKCSYLEISISQTFTIDFVKSFIESNGCTLLSEIYKSSEEIIDIKCKCNNVYKTTFNSFKNYNQIRCARCTRKMSKGEILIEDFLKNNNFEYIKQYKFEDLKADNGKHYLKFDFAIIKDDELIQLIEFDGKQHEKPIDFYGGNKAFEVLKSNDRKKDEYCSNKGIKLHRIPYNEIKNINYILKNLLLVNNDNTVPS